MRILRYILIFCLLTQLVGFITAQTSPSIAYMEISPDGNFVAGVGDFVIRIWDSATGLLLHEVSQDGFVRDLSWSPDSTRLVTVTSGGFVRVWNIAQPGNPIGTLLAEFQPEIVVLETVAWSPDGLQLAVGGSYPQPRIQLWSANTYQYVTELPWNLIISNIAWNPDGQRNLLAVYLRQDYGVLLISNDPQQIPYLACANCNGDGEIRDVEWNNAGTQLAISDSNGLIQIVNVDTNQRTLSIQTAGSINTIAWNANGTLIASANYDGISFTFEVWDSATGNLLSSIPGSHVVGFNPINQDLIYVDYINLSSLIITPISEVLCDTTIVSSNISALNTAISTANALGTPQTICLEAGTYTLTAAGTSLFRIAKVNTGGRLVLNNITVSNGGICNLGTLELVNSTIPENDD
jgi:WD40 repeat protein